MEASLYLKPVVELSWGKAPTKCEPGSENGSLRTALEGEVGLKAKVETTSESSKLNVCREVSIYGETSFSFSPPIAAVECVKISKTFFEEKLWASPVCTEEEEPVGPMPLGAFEVTATTAFSPKTNLTWTRQSAPGGLAYTWQEAKDYCAQLPLEGGGWRLPVREELRTLSKPDKAVFPDLFLNSNAGMRWSASSRDQASGGAWVLDLTGGKF